MIKVTLKDGVVKEFESPVSVLQIAESISEGLARNACCGLVDGEVKDLRFVVENDAQVSICTFDDEDGKRAFRHTASHIMAQAIKRLFPETKLAIGPSIADGFYYDFDRETPFTEEDLQHIEAEMKKIAKEILPLSVLNFREKKLLNLWKKKANHIRLNLLKTFPRMPLFPSISRANLQTFVPALTL